MMSSQQNSVLKLAVLQTVHDGRIYTVKLYCDQNYPDKVTSKFSLYHDSSLMMLQA